MDSSGQPRLLAAAADDPLAFADLTGVLRRHALAQVHLDVRADSALVKLFHRGQLVKTHPRQRPGGRVTDPDDLPEHKAGYALRDLDRLVTTAGTHGPEVGIYAQRLLDDKLPWTRCARSSGCSG